jgi:hypothetical protein
MIASLCESYIDLAHVTAIVAPEIVDRPDWPARYVEVEIAMITAARPLTLRLCEQPASGGNGPAHLPFTKKSLQSETEPAYTYTPEQDALWVEMKQNALIELDQFTKKWRSFQVAQRTDTGLTDAFGHVFDLAALRAIGPVKREDVGADYRVIEIDLLLSSGEGSRFTHIELLAQHTPALPEDAPDESPFVYTDEQNAAWQQTIDATNADRRLLVAQWKDYRAGQAQPPLLSHLIG